LSFSGQNRGGSSLRWRRKAAHALPAEKWRGRQQVADMVLSAWNPRPLKFRWAPLGGAVGDCVNCDGNMRCRGAGVGGIWRRGARSSLACVARWKVVAEDVAPGLVTETNSWRVTAETVVHGDGLGLTPAFLKRWQCYGYRFEAENIVSLLAAAPEEDRLCPRTVRRELYDRGIA